MYCNTLLEGEVYCNRNCIIGLAGKEIISQYSILYCDMGTMSRPDSRSDPIGGSEPVSGTRDSGLGLFT